MSLRRREYAARARARAEGGGSWPFGGDAGPLPPVEVRRFLWWQDEAAAVEEEEVEVERRMAAKRRKRSVAELFAAVPRVPRGRGGGQQGSGKGKKAPKRKAEKDKGKLVLAVSVKTKKKKKVPAGIDVREKVAHCIASTVERRFAFHFWYCDFVGHIRMFVLRQVLVCRSLYTTSGSYCSADHTHRSLTS